MANWIIDKDKYDEKPRWYTCPICRYTHDNEIDHVSETNVCPNCKNEIGDVDKIVIRDHLLVVAGIKAAEMACAGEITVYNSLTDERDLPTFITFIVDRYCELDTDMDFGEYVRNNLILGYS